MAKRSTEHPESNNKIPMQYVMIYFILAFLEV